MVRMGRHAADLTGERRLCLAGGVALNCVANSRLLTSGAVEEMWVQPASGDAGSSLGAALWYWHDQLGNPRTDRGPTDSMSASALGPWFEPDQIASWLSAARVEHRRVPDAENRCEEIAARIADGQVVGWFEGRMEFGPRALGHRSILADPRSPDAQSDLNLRVKGRESFRPFAPAVLWEHASEWFDLDRPSPYMLFTFPVAESRRLDVVDGEGPGDIDFVERVRVPRSQIPACTHVDGSARVQTVHADSSPQFHRLLRAFHRHTGCPVLLNTSFNLGGEPIVCTPDDALDTARRAGLDILVLEDCIVETGGVAESTR